MKLLPRAQQALLAVAALVALVAVPTAAEHQHQGQAVADGASEFAVPCNDDGLAHIPDLPDGARRPYSVRKRSRTVHREDVRGVEAVEDAGDAAPLPPGRRRFDAVLPDEEGHDIKNSTPARGQRGQRELEDDGQDARDAVNEVAEQGEQGELQETAALPGLRRAPRRPKKVTVVPYPTGGAEHDAKSDAVVDSIEAVRRYPTHLPSEEGDADAEDDNLSSNDIPGAPARDQVALEDVPTASTEQRVDGDDGGSVVEADPDLPPGYRSKFPKRTFSSDAGGNGDVLRVKPRKRVNRYRASSSSSPPPPPHPGGQEGEPWTEQPVAAEPTQPRRPPTVAEPRPRPRPRPQPQFRQGEPADLDAGVVDRSDAAVPASVPTGPGTANRGQQRYRESHRVRSGQPAQRRRPAYDGDAVSSDGLQTAQPQRRRPQPKPRPAEGELPAPAADLTQEQQQQEQPRRRPLRRRRPRPRTTTEFPAPAATDDQTEATADAAVAATTPAQDGLVLENLVTPSTPVDDVPPQRKPLRRRRPRPRPILVTAEGAEIHQDLDGGAQRQAVARRRRPEQQAAGRRVVAEESFEQSQQGSRGHGRRLTAGAAAQDLPSVEVQHDGTALEKQEHSHEPTLVRSAVKKVPAGGHAGDPSPALIQQIVKNTLRRLKPQIAEHEGDVGVDILVKIIQVDE